MNSSQAQTDLISLIAGEIDTATLASRHGVTEEEALRWRAVFVAGMKASVGGQSMGRRNRHRMILLAGTVLATAAFAQLSVFTADTPAVASQVNGNFNQLKTWLEQKVGPVTNTDLLAPAKVIAQAYAPTYAAWTTHASSFTGSAGIVNDNGTYKALMIAGNTSAGTNRKINLYDDVFVGNDLAVTRNLAVTGSQSVSGNLSLIGNLSVTANAWGTQTDTAEGTMSLNTLAFTMCEPGTFVCGIGLAHHSGNNNYWTGGRIALRCCAL